MGYLEFLIHIFKKNQMVLWKFQYLDFGKFQYLDFGKFSDTPTWRVNFGKGCPTAKTVQFSQKR